MSRLLPLVALGLNILYFRTHQALFSAIAWGATVWTTALVVETNLLSAFGTLSQKPILGFWLLYCCVSACFLLPRIRKITFRPNFSFPCLFFAFVLAITLFLALAYAPNYSDSLDYHLPRVMHWLQNVSLCPRLFCLSFVLFCAFMTWQPWAARLHLRWSILGAPH